MGDRILPYPSPLITAKKTMAKTLYDKIWESHRVLEREDGTALLYIDRQLLHEVTSPQAFEGLKLHNRRPWRVDSNIATPDHNVPTRDRSKGLAGIQDPVSKIQVVTLDNNCREFGIEQFDILDRRQGIVHVVGPEQGITLPGMTIVCGDSHTSTHGAFAALAQGIGTSEVEHVLATQTLVQRKAGNMQVQVLGELPTGVGAKDLILAIIAQLGTAGGTGYTLEYTGAAVRALSMEGRMTLCNMSIEAGARAGLVAFDDTTQKYLQGRPYAPSGEMWESAVQSWQELHSDADALFDQTVDIDVSQLEPQVSWGSSPQLVAPISGQVPDPADYRNPNDAELATRALAYMDLEPGQAITSIHLDRIFIGSCTNARIEDLRAAADILKGRKISAGVSEALVVPGSGLVKEQAEAEGLAEIFLAAGFQWRDPGCSMCLAMNDDRLGPGERCASTSNRNFEGRQGHGGRTHLVSPVMAAAAAVAGHFIDARELMPASAFHPAEGG